jgi:hypothetical protein
MSWETYEVSVRRQVTERYRVKARSRDEAMNLVEQKYSDLDPIDISDGDAEVDYHRIDVVSD